MDSVICEKVKKQLFVQYGRLYDDLDTHGGDGYVHGQLAGFCKALKIIEPSLLRAVKIHVGEEHTK